MSTPTFEEVIAAAQGEHHEVAAIKQSFVEPLAELSKLRTQWAKQYPHFRERADRIEHRRQQAMQAGVDVTVLHHLMHPWMQGLVGGGGSNGPGLMNSIGMQIEGGMNAMTRFSLRDVPQRVWMSWPNIPSRVRDGLLAIEDHLYRLEDIVKDGGRLQSLVEQATAHKAGIQS